tara:strand:- start:62 stop:304 length:243 start_codon:yes stop_codon:yes gene_type:complete
MIEAIKSSGQNDSQIEEWFNRKIDANEELKDAWNTLAINLGKKRRPGAWIFALAKRFLYNCKDPAIDTAFKAIDWDEKKT